MPSHQPIHHEQSHSRRWLAAGLVALSIGFGMSFSGLAGAAEATTPARAVSANAQFAGNIDKKVVTNVHDKRRKQARQGQKWRRDAARQGPYRLQQGQNPPVRCVLKPRHTRSGRTVYIKQCAPARKAPRRDHVAQPYPWRTY